MLTKPGSIFLILLLSMNVYGQTDHYIANGRQIPLVESEDALALRIQPNEADSFKEAIDEFIVDIKSCRTRPGFSEIIMPGERGHQTVEKSRDAGVEIPDFLWQDVMELVDELNVALQSN